MAGTVVLVILIVAEDNEATDTPTGGTEDLFALFTTSFHGTR